LMIIRWSYSIPNGVLTNFKVQTMKIIFRKLHNRIRFDLFNFPKGPDCRDTLIWKANSRTQQVRLAHVLMYQTIFMIDGFTCLEYCESIGARFQTKQTVLWTLTNLNLVSDMMFQLWTRSLSVSEVVFVGKRGDHCHYFVRHFRLQNTTTQRTSLTWNLLWFQCAWTIGKSKLNNIPIRPKETRRVSAMHGSITRRRTGLPSTAPQPAHGECSRTWRYLFCQ
jgi:hypothetical protein